MANQRWNELDPRIRRAVIAVGAVEGVLKVAALIDLARRPASRVNGSKRTWGWAIALINSAGLVPVLYFRRGRR